MAIEPPPTRGLVARTLFAALPRLRRLVDERDDLLRANAEQTVERGRLRLRLKRTRAKSARLKIAHEDLHRQLAALAAANAVTDETDLRYLFVVTYGRSGSTLLQGLLTSLPGHLIRGENSGAVYELFQFHQQASMKARDPGIGASPASAWFGIGGYSEELAFSAIRRLVLTTLIRPEADSRVVGFKEIRWQHDDLAEYIDFLRGVFPGARFIINTRDHEDVAASKWWARHPDPGAALAHAEEQMLALAEELGGDFFHVHYNDYVDEPSRLVALFEWLGVPFDESVVKQVMAIRHSY